MKLNAPTDSQTHDATPAPCNDSTLPSSLDGDLPIEGDPGTVDSSSQAHIPPPPPAR